MDASIYRHLSYMLYNKVQVIKCLTESVGGNVTAIPDSILDNDLYFENFHQIVEILQRFPPRSWIPLLEEAFHKLYTNRAQFTSQIDQLYYEHFNPSCKAMPKDIACKCTWPGWNVKFLNILKINRNIQKNNDAYQQFYTEGPLLSYNRCPCQKCKTDWKLNHNKEIHKLNEKEIPADLL